EPLFSRKGGFYEEAFNLEISSNEQGVKIYYTTDGSDPEPGTSGTLLYTGSINIKSRVGEPDVLSMIKNISADNSKPWKAPAKEVFKGSVIKAAAVRDDGKKSKIVTHTYFVDPDMNDKYSLPIVSIVTDQSNFFDDTKGIYVSQNCQKTGSEWERPVHVEFFEPDGSLGFSQYAGVRIHGGWTRKFPQKSLRLYADKDYDEDKGKFSYEVFPGLKKKATGKKLKGFDSLLLRNSGNDWDGVMFRDAMMHSLVAHLDLETMAYRPSIVFLNGEYWGIHNIRERYDKDYIASHYDLDDDNVIIIDPFEPPEVMEGTEEDAKDYTNGIIGFLKSNPVNEKENYDYIKTKMDVNNFIDYNISHIFFGNTDWPGRNMSMWKYRTPDGQYNPQAPKGQDGRWRWMLKDTDFGFNLYTTSVTHDTLSFATAERSYSTDNPEWATFLLRTLLGNTDFRNEFINRFADNLNTSFVPERVSSVIEEFAAGIEEEMPDQCDRWQVISMNDAQMEFPGMPGMTGAQNQIQFPGMPSQMKPGWRNKVQNMKDFASQRPANVRQHILNKFKTNGVTGTYTISLNANSTQGYIKINSVDIKTSTPGVTNPASWTGTYFSGVPITLSAKPEKGYQFDHWEGISGVIQTSDTITLTHSENTSITAVFKASSGISPSPTSNIKCGDVNGDGKVNSTDYSLLKRYLLEISEIPVEDIYAAADLNKDGKINSTDYTILRRYLLEIITSLPY
ncbi:MAG: dockerin, partial [Clostridiaceae bacterium]|nr:dockerin [Clostridiaceae bacterium]